MKITSQKYTRRWLLAFSTLALCVSPTSANAAIVEPGFEVSAFVEGFTLPTSMAFSTDGRIFVAEKGGVVRVVKNGAVLLEPVIALTDINTFGDRGLLGIAVDPNFLANGYLYLSYTYENTPGFNFGGPKTGRIVRVTVTGDIASEPSKVVLVGSVGGDVANPSCESFPEGTDCIPSDSESHSMGGLRFGLDGKLYATTGDGSDFSSVDPRALRAQNIDSLAGKMLRINPDGTAPTDNPFYNGDANANRSKVYSLGHRNMFRFNFHPASGLLFGGDVGWSSWEEINNIALGNNYGWPCWEGMGTTTYNCTASSAVTLPVYTYGHDASGAGSITAGAFPSNSAYPAAYNNSLFVGDYAQNWIKFFNLDEAGNFLSVNDFIPDTVWPVDLSTGPDGNVYYIDIAFGSLNKITHTTGNRQPVPVVNAAPTSGLATLNVNFSSGGSTDPDGDGLTFNWNFGDGDTSTLPNPSHAYTANGAYNATLTLTDIYGSSGSKSILITVGNQSPLANITNPASGSLYTGGQIIQLEGTASDPETGDLPASAFHWQIILHHNTHVHFMQTFDNTKNPSFVADDHNDTDVYTEVELTVTDPAGLVTTRSINLYLNNGTSGGNLIQNPSMEIAASGPGRPASWFDGWFGNLNPIFTYPVAGFDGAKAAKLEVTSYTDGNAKWYFSPVFVTPGSNYLFSSYYTSSVDTAQSAQFGFADGTYQYQQFATLSPATAPTKVEYEITIPANVETLSVFHELNSIGELTTDNFSLTLVEPPSVPNLILNPSLENAGAGEDPASWLRGGWGTNDRVLTYPTPGVAGASAAKAEITSYTDGDAKWFFEDVSVVGGTSYTLTHKYKSDVTTELVARVTVSGGGTIYQFVGNVPANANWAAYSINITVPANAVSLTVFHLLKSVGTLEVDDFNLTGDSTPPPPPPPHLLLPQILSKTHRSKLPARAEIPINGLREAGEQTTACIPIRPRV